LSTVSLTFPSGGSSSETFHENGAAFANKFFTFKSALDMSSIAILRAIENAGATPFTSATRHSASVGYTCTPENAASLVGSVISQTACSFEPWDVHETLTVAKQQAAEAVVSPQVRVPTHSGTRTKLVVLTLTHRSLSLSLSLTHTLLRLPYRKLSLLHLMEVNPFWDGPSVTRIVLPIV
jgi:hypothetical protein